MLSEPRTSQAVPSRSGCSYCPGKFRLCREPGDFRRVTSVMDNKTRPFDWFNANLDAWTLALETPAVIALRLAKIGAGKVRAAAKPGGWSRKRPKL